MKIGNQAFFLKIHMFIIFSFSTISTFLKDFTSISIVSTTLKNGLSQFLLTNWRNNKNETRWNNKDMVTRWSSKAKNQHENTKLKTTSNKKF
jgi:hypothetical protein